MSCDIKTKNAYRKGLSHFGLFVLTLFWAPGLALSIVSNTQHCPDDTVWLECRADGEPPGSSAKILSSWLPQSAS